MSSRFDMTTIFLRFSLLICFVFMSSYGRCDSSPTMKEKYTFIFDFDETLQYPAINNRTYFYQELFIRSVFGDTFFNKEKGNIENFVQQEESSNSRISILKRLMQKYNVIPKQKDIHYVVEHLVPTKHMDMVIEKLRQNGHRVIIIGGGTFGCAIIPEFAKRFGFKKEDIYSGYFKDFSEIEIKKALLDKWRYANCGNPEIQTPYSSNKSDLIRLLKERREISEKIVHVGDGENDLEVWKSGEVDIFIGFGVNIYREKVESDSDIYVKTMPDFILEIEKITGIQFEKNLK